MSNQTIFWAAPVAPLTLIDGLLKCAVDLGASNITLDVRTNVDDQIGQFAELNPKAPDAHQQLSNFKADISNSQWVFCTSANLSGLESNASVNYQLNENEVAAKLIVNCQIGSVRRKVAKALNSHFDLQPRQVVLTQSLPQVVRDQWTAGQLMINTLGEEVSRLGRLSSDQLEKLSNYVFEKTEELDRRYSERSTQLDAEHKLRLDAIAKREEEHAAKVKDYELRESKAVRRDLLAQMSKKIEAQKEISLSPGTNRKRSAVRWTCICTMIGAASAIVYLGYKFVAAAAPDWHHIAPITAAIALFVSTLVYFIKWNDQWFRDHAQAEFRNMKFSADILRASWIAELLFEWQKEKESEFPGALIASFSSGLFQEEKQRVTEHPADLLAKALRNVTELSATKDGFVYRAGKASR